MKETAKKVFWIIFCIVMVVGFVIWVLLNPGPEHIEDTNGDDDYSLQVITEADVIAQEMGSRGSLSTSESKLEVGSIGISSGIKYSSKKFTGVNCLYRATIFKGSDIFLDLYNFKINGGNFAFYIVLDGEIVGQITPNETEISEFYMSSIDKTATIEYVIAGESASFEFTTSEDWMG